MTDVIVVGAARSKRSLANAAPSWTDTIPVSTSSTGVLEVTSRD